MGLFDGDCLKEYEVSDFVDAVDGIDQMKHKKKERHGR